MVSLQPVRVEGSQPAAGESRLAPGSEGDYYVQLKHLLKTTGILERQPAYYALKIAVTLVMIGLGAALVIQLRGTYFELLDAAFLAFAFTQAAFIVHDSGHRQIARSAGNNDLIGILHSNLLLGASFSWWVWKHNKHHANPNQP